MIDIVRKNGDKIDLAKLGAELGCAVMETSALKGEGSMAVAEKALIDWVHGETFDQLMNQYN
jgi:ferrous iron transport protein B